MPGTRAPLSRFSLPRLVARWANQVAAPVAATLLASAVFAALPHVFVPVLAPSARSDADARLTALTSGGKFAARVPGVEWMAATALDPAAPGLVGVSRTAWAETPLGAVPDLDKVAPAPPRVLRLPRRPAAKRSVANEGRRPTVTAIADGTAKPAAPIGTETTPMAEAAGAGDSGVAPKLWTTARSVWNGAASAGLSLVSRVVP